MIKPIIGVPIDVGTLDSLDAFLSTVQMSGGISLATFPSQRLLWVMTALKILDISPVIVLNAKDLANRLRVDRQAYAEAVLAKDVVLQQQLNR